MATQHDDSPAPPPVKPDVATTPPLPQKPAPIDKVKAAVARRISVPVWVILSVVGFTLVVDLVSRPETTQDDDSIYELIRGVPREDGSIDWRASMIANAAKRHIELNADNPGSIEWVEFKRVNDVGAENQSWIVWYRARNRHNALQLFQCGIIFETEENEDGDVEVPVWFPEVESLTYYDTAAQSANADR